MLRKDDALPGGRWPLGERMLFGEKDSFCGGGTLGKTMPFEEENFPRKGCLEVGDAFQGGRCPL